MINFQTYEQQMAPIRLNLSKSQALLKLFSIQNQEPLLTAFLLYFSSIGIHMTKQVDSWIKRAGLRSQELGFEAIGQALIDHAIHEQGHHLMLVEDSKTLVNVWNQKYEPKLDVRTFLNMSVTPSSQAYIDMHENIILSESPYCQIAVEYEIESLSVTYGKKLLELGQNSLGDLKGLQFLDEHVKLDVGHTHYNQKQLSLFIDQHPNTIDSLVAAGTLALKSYANFLNECLTLADNLVSDSAVANPS